MPHDLAYFEYFCINRWNVIRVYHRVDLKWATWKNNKSKLILPKIQIAEQQ